MPVRLLKWLSICLLLLAGLVMLGQWALGSRVGRDMVEQQLWRVIDLPVRLNDEFSLRLFPAPAVKGSGISILSTEGQPILSTREYLARVELWPLLGGRVEIVALEFHDLRIPLESGAVIVVDEVTMAKNPGGEPLLIDAKGSLTDEKGELVTAEVKGTLDLSVPNIIVMEVLILETQAFEYRIEGITGEVSVDLVPTRFLIDLNWVGLGSAVKVTTELDGGRLNLESDPGLSIDSFMLKVGEYVIEGEGCYEFDDPPALHLKLLSQDLDLDTLSKLLEEFLLVATVPGDEGSSDSEEADEPFALPFEPYLRFEIKEAVYQGATAKDTVLRIGDEADCANFLP